MSFFKKIFKSKKPDDSEEIREFLRTHQEEFLSGIGFEELDVRQHRSTLVDLNPQQKHDEKAIKPDYWDGLPQEAQRELEKLGYHRGQPPIHL